MNTAANLANYSIGSNNCYDAKYFDRLLGSRTLIPCKRYPYNLVFLKNGLPDISHFHCFLTLFSHIVWCFSFNF